MGRKRIGLEPMTPQQRAKASRQKLLASGGSVVSLRISAGLADAIADIQLFGNKRTRQQAIEAAVFELAQRLADKDLADDVDQDEDEEEEYDGRFF